jgi:programmed cell death protein 5
MAKETKQETVPPQEVEETAEEIAAEQPPVEVEAEQAQTPTEAVAPEARQRLNNLKMVKKDFAENIELQLIEMAQTGKLPIPLSDAQLKSILIQLQSRKRETKITRI